MRHQSLSFFGLCLFAPSQMCLLFATMQRSRWIWEIGHVYAFDTSKISATRNSFNPMFQLDCVMSSQPSLRVRRCYSCRSTCFVKSIEFRQFRHEKLHSSSQLKAGGPNLGLKEKPANTITNQKALHVSGKHRGRKATTSQTPLEIN